MRTRVLVAGVVVAAVAGAVAIVAAGGSAPRKPSGGATSMLAWTNGELVHVDPATLARRGKSLAVAEGPSTLSPDGNRLAIAGSNGDVIRFVDLERMRLDGPPLRLGPARMIDTMKWLDARTLVVLLWGAPPALLHVDVATRRVVSTRSIEGVVFARATSRTSLALLTGPQDEIGGSQLLVVDALRGVRAAQLPGVRSGYSRVGDERSGESRRISPGLAVDPEGGHAVVVPPGERVAEVDLDTLAVGYHELSHPVSLFGRLRDWLEPAAHAKSVQGPERHAQWLGRHTIVVNGIEQVGIRAKEGEHRQVARASGVYLIDTRSWSVRTLSRAAGSAVVAAGSVLVYGGPFAAGGGFSADAGAPVTALTAYSADGTERFRLFDDSHVRHVAAARHYAYVYNHDGTSIAVVDAAEGAVVRTVRTRAPVFVVAP